MAGISLGSSILAGGEWDPLTLRPEKDLKLPPWRESAARALVTGKDADAAKALEALRARKSELHDTKERMNSEIAALGSERGAFDDMLAWMKGRPGSLQRPDASLWYKLREAWKAGRVLSNDSHNGRHLEQFFAEEPQVFLVQHNWAAAFATATDYDGGDYRLPFERCCFEFQIAGRRVIVPMIATDDGDLSVICYSAGQLWLAPGEVGNLAMVPEEKGHEELHALNMLIHGNVKAICVALEAEVAASEVVRAPHKLNAAREKAGRPLLSDYRVVNLAKRSRTEALSTPGTEPGHRKRLHFRRGHWRHYEAHKTWIKWMLVGDPDLGFIDKHYRV